MAGDDREFEFIIVGAGSAGCTLANRLSSGGTHRVLVLEAGPPDRGFRSWQIHMPTALAHPLRDDTWNWFYHTMPEPHLKKRVIHCPRGRVLGGSSSINGMAYIRGHAFDYDKWAQAGCRGWSYREVLPYFRRAETFDRGSDDYHGGEGPLHVTSGSVGSNPLYRAFIDAAVEAGYAESRDLNGYRQEGVGRMDRTTRGGRRWSTAVAYLKPALGRPNLSLAVRAPVSRVPRRGGPGGRHRVPAGGADPEGSRHPGSDPGLGRHQLPAGAVALGHRACRRPRGPGGPPGARPPRRRPQPARPRGGLRPARMHAAPEPAQAPYALRQDEGRSSLVPHPRRAGGDQPHRSGGLHPQPGGRRAPGHPVPLPADGDDLRRLQRQHGPRLSGDGRHHAPAVARLREARLRRPAPAPRDPFQLSCRIRRPPLPAGRCPADP